MQKSLDQKLANIQQDPSCGDFILADAKDADMGGGVAAPGPRDPRAPDKGFRSLAEYRQSMSEIVEQGLVDIMLMSVGSCEVLAVDEQRFDASSVTPAVRANDTTDIWMASTAHYAKQPSLPFRTASIEHLQLGRRSDSTDEGEAVVDLGLYSITFNNDTETDRHSLEAYRSFRMEAEAAGFRHFLEVFAPNALVHPIDDVPRFVNDCIARTLAAVPKSNRPLFLKMPYFGPGPMETLASYDRSLIIGVLGGPSGTTHDAFRMLWEAKKYGGRAALFGRKINHAEHQLAMVQHLRWLADGEIEPAEAVRSYHGELAKRDIAPLRALEDDLKLTQV